MRNGFVKFGLFAALCGVFSCRSLCLERALGQSLTFFAETPKSLTPTFLGVVLTAFSEPSARQD